MGNGKRMTAMTIHPGILSGEVKVPPSKSMGHRAMICASLASGVSRIQDLPVSEDISATREALRALGAVFTPAEAVPGIPTEIDGSGMFRSGDGTETIRLDCGESGSTLRFLMPLSLLSGRPVIFDGRGRLGSRPMDVYRDYFAERGIRYEASPSGLPVTVSGRLSGGSITMRGDISSQFLSGFLFALPLLKENTEITVTGSLESRSYVDMTMDMLKRFDIDVAADKKGHYGIRGWQKYRPCDCRIEADYSQAAFWLAAGYLGHPVTCRGLADNTLQGDRKIVDILAGLVRADRSGEPVVIDLSQLPDLLPILAVAATFRRGILRLAGAGRTRMKESDRLAAMARELSGLGAVVSEMKDSLVITGTGCLRGGEADSHGDHRIAMALAIAALGCREPVTILNCRCVDKSYPEFWNDFRMLGGKILERDLG